MTTTTPASSAYIVRAPRILDGEPIVAGTRVSVRTIVLAYRFDPDVQRVSQAYPMLTPAAIHAALAFYQANQAEIDRHIIENEADTD